MEHPFRWGFVALCCLAALICPRPINRREKRLLAAALGLTAVADYFLLNTPIEGAEYVIGMMVFCFAHMGHILRHTGGRLWWWLCPAAPIVTLAYLSPPHSDLPYYGMAALYALLLLTAAITAARRFARDRTPNNGMILAGMALFVCCDVCVALFNTVWRTTAAEILIWTFYAPSQLLLALSIYKPGTHKLKGDIDGV